MKPTYSAKKVGATLAAFAVLGIVAAWGQSSMTPKRPSALSIEVRPHGSVLASMRAIVNGAPIVMSSMQGRNQTGGLAYQSPSEADLSVQLMWYDLTDERFYQSDFTLDTRKLSTFGDSTDHASVKIVAGPGADITVTTPHPEALRLVGLNRMDEITPEMDVDVVLAELCASASKDDPSADKRLRQAIEDEIALGEAIFNRDAWLNANAAPMPRCPAGEGQ